MANTVPWLISSSEQGLSLCLYCYIYFFVLIAGDVSLSSELVIIVPTSIGWGDNKV
jgi:hypothetical protein